jgi:PAS domain S-box-containing protein
MQENLRKSEEFNKRIIENSTDCIKILDLDGRLEFMSPGGQELLEIEDIGPYLNQSWIDFWKGSDRTAALETISRAKKGDAGRFRGYCPTEKGTEKWWGTIITPIVGKDGKVEQLLAVSRDITKHRKADEALRESEEKYRLVLENAYDAIFIGQDEVVKFPNPKTQEMSGYSAEELAKLPFISLVHPEDKDMVLDRYMRWMKGEEPPATFDFRIINKAGEELWVELNTTAVSWNKRPATLNILRDITQQKKLEAQLLQSQKMEAIGTLAGGVAHDFNNLLTAILGYAELSLMGLGKDNPVREEIEEIKKAGNSAASLIRQLLAFSRKQIIQPKIVDLNEFLSGMEKMLGRLLGEDVELLAIPEPALWQVEADPGQMEQVIMNLAVNARDAMPMGGKLTIETANMDLDENYFREHGIEKQPGSYVMLAVSDTGSGMDKETQEHIFEPFFTTKEIDKGTGLGLSTVYGIVKQNNGFIWVYSEPGQGTTFKIYLPKVKGDVEAVEKERTPVVKLDGSETVLIVEDDDGLRKLAQNVLQQHGYRVLTAENGEDALKVSEAHDGSIDLMITDVVMPKMGGRETAERLQPLYPRMKVIYMSGYTDNAIVHHGVLASGLNFLEKPFSPKGLARKVREVLDK